MTQARVTGVIQRVQMLLRFCAITKEKLAIIVIGETKLDDIFPDNQFVISGFKKPGMGEV